MQDSAVKHSNNWTVFTALSFAIAAGMMAIGIYNLEASFSAKGFYIMASLMLVHSSISLTKTLRDREENMKLHNRIEDAKTEKLLIDIGKSDQA